LPWWIVFWSNTAVAARPLWVLKVPVLVMVLVLVLVMVRVLKVLVLVRVWAL
jgi:hypothetical protein